MDISVELARQGEKIDVLQREMKEIKADVRTTKDIAMSVQSLSQSVKMLTENMKDIKADISEMKKEPASAWKNFKWLLVGVLVSGIASGVVGSMLSLVMK